MPLIDTLVKINISQQTQAVAQASFSIPLIIGSSNRFSPAAKPYFSPAAMLADGFLTSDPEYIYALEMFDQDITPTQFYVGKRTARVAQVDTIAVGTLATGHAYNFMLSGQLISYTSQVSDAQQDILAALLAAILAAFPSNAPCSGVVSGSGSGALLTLTAAVSGVGFSVSAVDADLTHVAVTTSHGPADDLVAILAVSNAWYGVALCSNDKQDILQMGAAIEPLKKIFIGVSHDSDVPQTVNTDVGSILQSKSYKRTGLIYTVASYNLGIEAAWMGGQLPKTPGSTNWAYKTAIGLTPDTDQQIPESAVATLIGNPIAQVPGKNVNIYKTVGGRNIMMMGQMAGGQYIDLTVGIDWLESRLQESIFAMLADNDIIPFTDQGVTQLIQAVESVIAQGVTNGLIDGKSTITVSAPPVLSVPLNQRANRVAPTISFNCRLQGAINAVNIAGTVTV